MELKELALLKHNLSQKGGLFPTSKRDWNKKERKKEKEKEKRKKVHKKIKSLRICFKRSTGFIFSSESSYINLGFHQPIVENTVKWQT